MNRSNDESPALPHGVPYQLPAEGVLTALGGDARLGLTEAEARTRLEQHGRNELTADAPVPAWRKCARAQQGHDMQHELETRHQA